MNRRFPFCASSLMGNNVCNLLSGLNIKNFDLSVDISCDKSNCRYWLRAGTSRISK